MDSPGFWKLVDHAVVSTADLEQRQVWLVGRLALPPAGEIGDFAVRLEEQRRRVDTRARWQTVAAFEAVHSGELDEFLESRGRSPRSVGLRADQLAAFYGF